MPERHDRDQGLRLILVTGSGPEFAQPVLELAGRAGHRIVGMVEPRDPLAASPRPLRWAEWIYHRGLKNRTPPYLRPLARRYGIPYRQLAGLSDEELKTWLRQARADLLILYNAPIVRKELYSLARFGGINLHPSLLPRYRGARPVLWMHRNFDLEGGVTLHYIDERPDAGDIIAQEPFRIVPGMTELDVEREAIYRRGLPLLTRALDGLSNGGCPALPQEKESPTVLARRVSQETYERMIEWESWDVERVWHFLRCTDRWLDFLRREGISTRWQEFSIGPFDRHPPEGTPPGTLVRNGGLHFACRNGRVWVQRRLRPKRLVREILQAISG